MTFLFFNAIFQLTMPGSSLCHRGWSAYGRPRIMLPIVLTETAERSSEVDGDGLLDLVCHFFTQLTGFEMGDTLGHLTGATSGGFPLFGVDSVRIVH